jgi:hypothetical protein
MDSEAYTSLTGKAQSNGVFYTYDKCSLPKAEQ